MSALYSGNFDEFLFGGDVSTSLPQTTATATAPTPIASAAPTTPTWIQSIAPISSGLSSIGNSVANIFRGINSRQEAGYYNAAGQFVPIVAPQNPGVGGTTIGTSVGNATSLVSQFLPLILILGIFAVLISLFRGKRR